MSIPVAYICHKLTIMFLFCPFHSDDAFLCSSTRSKSLSTFVRANYDCAFFGYLAVICDEEETGLNFSDVAGNEGELIDQNNLTKEELHSIIPVIVDPSNSFVPSWSL